jgi:hypothetical protein
MTVMLLHFQKPKETILAGRSGQDDPDDHIAPSFSIGYLLGVSDDPRPPARAFLSILLL